ncbi:hypothetical protein [Blastococcus sp. KM273129]|uniref:hypothetical protein n=1 Tax=Blastococcus sp. KM273129 TaxID=2570315 RepID=UPI001F252FD6|nr:hypothetical protein [Blastococcus sp. KM273129]MCF6733690.1 hypothetical protein [Blastococcus sp. KM273129]
MTRTEPPHRRTAAPGHAAPTRGTAPWIADMRRMGLYVSTDGTEVTVTSQVLPSLFGRAAYQEFTVTMSSTSLVRLRHLLTGGVDVLHIPVRGRVLTDQGELRSTSRLIASAQYLPARRVVLEVTTWVTAADGSEAWLDTYLLDDLTGPDLDHVETVHAMWSAGVRPCYDAARYIAATPGEARTLHDTLAPAERNARIDLLIALRTP